MDTKQVRGRRRRFAVEAKRRIVEESFEPTASVSQVARRHDINTNQLFNWRRAYRQDRLNAPGGLVPIKLAEAARVAPGGEPGTLEIDFAGGHHVSVRGAVDVAALRVVLATLR